MNNKYVLAFAFILGALGISAQACSTLPNNHVMFRSIDLRQSYTKYYFNGNLIDEPEYTKKLNKISRKHKIVFECDTVYTNVKSGTLIVEKSIKYRKKVLKSREVSVIKNVINVVDSTRIIRSLHGSIFENKYPLVQLSKYYDVNLSNNYSFVSPGQERAPNLLSGAFLTSGQASSFNPINTNSAFFTYEVFKNICCNLTSDNRNKPYKVLLKLPPGITLGKIIESYSQCDTFLANPEICKVYSVCLKDYNRGLLHLENDHDFQAFGPDDTITSEYIWFINLQGMLIDRFDAMIHQLHGEAEVSDLLETYKQGNLKFIDIQRIEK